MDPRLYSTHFGDPRTLVDLFRAELWRGRDNARVTFRTPFSLRSMASLGVPVVDLAMLAGSAGTLIWLGAGPGLLAVAATGLAVTALAGLRVFSKMPLLGLAPAELCRVLLVAAVHDSGRALALIMRSTHATRRAVRAGS